jgi:hypothetical protein
VVGGLQYRIDQVRCANWPPLSRGLFYAPVYLLALALLSLSWIGLARLSVGKTLRFGSGDGPAQPPLTPLHLLLGGLACHLVALLTPPFLSDDGLAYAAVGRAMDVYHRSAYVPLGESLPLQDPFRALIQRYDLWLGSGSAYAPGFNALAWLVSRVAGDDLMLHLRLYQLTGLVSVVVSALIAGQAAREWALQGVSASIGTERGRQAAARAMALVLFCPLSIVEATINAHNDGLLMLSVALFALFMVRMRPFFALVALLLGLFIKVSALLLLGLYLAHLLCAWLDLRPPRLSLSSILLLCGIGAFVTALFAWLLFPILMHYSSTTAKLLGSPLDQYPYCTRSIECLPRAFLHLVLRMPTAAWFVGLCFRALSGAFLLYMAARSGRGVQHLRDAAAFLLIYYLFLHGYSHPWYGLSLLPLLSFASPTLLPAMLALPISNLAHYALDFPYNCDQRPVVVGLTELIQALIVIVPPAVLIYWYRPVGSRG